MPDYLNRAINEAFNLSKDIVMKDLDIDEQGRFWITNTGKVISFCRDKTHYKHIFNNGTGYQYITINKNNYYIHRLLAFSFTLDQEKREHQDLYEVHHLDRNRLNNNLCNLAIVSIDKHKAIHKIWDKLDDCKVIEWDRLEI